MWRVTPPGTSTNTGETSAIRTRPTASSRVAEHGIRLVRAQSLGSAAIIGRLSQRHFVKYTFLKLDPAWRRLDAEERARATSASSSPPARTSPTDICCSVLAVGTRGDAELLIISEAENLDRIHEFHVVLGQSGLMKWAQIPYSFLGMRKSSEYSDELRTMPRGFRGKYVFVYPFVKSREWYALPADERWRIMQGHIEVGREYPGVDNHTTYSFGLDDQEFVVAFDTDDVGTFLDLVQRLRTTEASAVHRPRHAELHLHRDVAARALNALDGEPVSLERACGRLRCDVPARAAPARSGATARRTSPRGRSRTCARAIRSSRS